MHYKSAEEKVRGRYEEICCKKHQHVQMLNLTKRQTSILHPESTIRFVLGLAPLVTACQSKAFWLVTVLNRFAAFFGVPAQSRGLFGVIARLSRCVLHLRSLIVLSLLMAS